MNEKLLNRLTNWLGKGFTLAVIGYLIVLTILTIFFFLGWVNPQTIPTPDWWTALGIVVTLTLAILVINVFREKTYLDTQKKLADNYNSTQNKIEENKKEIEYTKQLSSLSTILLDIATEENKSSEKWQNNLIKIETLYKLGFISDNDIHRISLEAWKQDDILSAFNLRKLPYLYSTDKVKNKLNFLSILPYIFSPEIDSSIIENKFKRLYSEKNVFLDEIGFKKVGNQFDVSDFFKIHNCINDSDEIYAYSLTARYLFKRKRYNDSLYFFNLAIEKGGKTFKRWHYRYLIELDFIKGDYKKMESDFKYAIAQKEWNEDYKYITFQDLFQNIINIINDKPVNKKNKYLYLKSIDVNHFDRFSMWNFTSILNESSIEKKKIDRIKKQYKDYYVFFGADDDNFLSDFKIENIEKEKEKIFNKLID